MTVEGIVGFLAAICVLWELEQMRKNTDRMLALMEGERDKRVEAYEDIRSINVKLENEIIDTHDRRMRDSLQ